MPNFFAALLLLSTCVRGEGAPRAITVPPELQLSEDPLDKDKNGMIWLLEAVKRPEPGIEEKIGLALEQLRSGEKVVDTDLLKELRERHRLAERRLKAPVRCLPQKDFTSFIMVVSSLFKGAEILSRQATNEGDHAAAKEYLATSLEWSRLVRHGRPTILEATIAYFGWRSAFTCALQEWETHPDQEAGLKILSELFEKNRISRNEWGDIIRHDAQWWFDQGGTKGWLDNFPKGEPFGSLFFKEPFGELTPEQLRELPYDEKAEVTRSTDEWLTQLRYLRENKPLRNWPGFQSEDHRDRTLDDYRKRANGLGDLVHEQMKSVLPMPQLGPFFSDAAMETCLAWLKAERARKPFGASSGSIGRDPVDGDPLRIDIERRTIRSIGLDLNRDEPEADHAGAGFVPNIQEPTLVVPRWRERK